MAGVQMILFLLTALSSSAVILVNGFAYELTIDVGPGKEECFHQPILRTGIILDVDYQLIEAQHLDISFRLNGPQRQVLKMDRRQREGSHQIHITEPGDYQLCFDNTFSAFASKQVFFEVYADIDDDTFPNTVPQLADPEEVEQAEEIIDITMEQIKNTLKAVQKHTEKTRSLQALLTSHMKRDRSISEDNYTRVNIFSGIYLSAMVLVSVGQVIMIRSLFNTGQAHHIKVPT
ncbi:transmembrane emp24 domain-containing protein 1-like [Watersipora subatra]|uniref:transmembrane emp24 domain-containing protein 1-like n=1 Tax=Watersipora subatra TaxID=2589382 RepID=UPI00355BE745